MKNRSLYIRLAGSPRRLFQALVVAVVASCVSPGAAFAGAEAYLTDFATLLVADTYNPSVVARIPMSGTISAPPVVGPGGTQVYVPLQTAVAVFDVGSRTVVKTIAVPGRVSLAILSQRANRLFVAGTEPLPGGGSQGV